MQWEQTRLPTTAEPGYGERALPAGELAKQAGKPTLVWFYSVEDEDANRACEATVLANEDVGLTLRRFRCVKIDVESIADARTRAGVGDTPAFVVYDPKGEEIVRLQGRKADSLSQFSGMLKHAWGRLFTMNQRDFAKQMTKILDRLDRVSSQKTVLEAKRQRAEESGNRQKVAEVAREQEELAAVEAAIQKDEAEIVESCALREEYLREADEVAAR